MKEFGHQHMPTSKLSTGAQSGARHENYYDSAPSELKLRRSTFTRLQTGAELRGFDLDGLQALMRSWSEQMGD